MARRRRIVASLAGFGLGALSACSPSELGAAAVVDETRITVTQIQGSLAQVRSLQGRFGVANEDSSAAARNEVQRRVIDLVFEKAARDLGVAVSAGEVSTAEATERDLVGGDTGLARVLASSNLSFAVLDDVFRQQLLNQKMIKMFGGGTGLTQDQINLKIEDRLVTAAKSMRIRINPRYGRFDSNLGQISPAVPDFLRAAG
jgi:hypothetical protein